MHFFMKTTDVLTKALNLISNILTSLWIESVCTEVAVLDQINVEQHSEYQVVIGNYKNKPK